MLDVIHSEHFLVSEQLQTLREWLLIQLPAALGNLNISPTGQI